MQESIHGHEVLRLILSAPHPLTQDEIRAETARLHGPDARYHTCSAEAMTIDELLEFLSVRGKISGADDGIVAHREQMCDHE